MQLIKTNPTTPGTRHKIKIQKNLLSKDNFIFKNIIKYKHKFCGRSSINGRITVWHRGAGVKTRFRDISFKNEDLTAVSVLTSYDPNRNSFITLNFDLQKKTFFSTIASLKFWAGFVYSCNKNLMDLKFGFRTNLSQIPAGSIISNLSLSEKKKQTMLEQLEHPAK